MLRSGVIKELVNRLENPSLVLRIWTWQSTANGILGLALCPKSVYKSRLKNVSGIHGGLMDYVIWVSLLVSDSGFRLWRLSSNIEQDKDRLYMVANIGYFCLCCEHVTPETEYGG